MKIYREILETSFSITWKNKFLWVFGFFTSLVVAKPIVGVFQNLLDFSNKGDENIFIILRALPSVAAKGISDMRTVWEFEPGFVVMGIFLLFGVFLLAIVLYWIGIVSQGALVASITKFYEKSNYGFKQAFKRGTECFWRSLGVFISAVVLMWLSFSILSAPVAIVSLDNFVLHYIFLEIFLFVFLFVVFVVSIVSVFAVQYIVREDDGFLLAVHKSYCLLRENVLSCIEIFFILSIVNIFAFSVTALVIFLAELPVLLFQFVLKLSGFIIAVKLGVLFSVFLFVVLSVIFAGFLMSFELAVWTLFFNKLSEQTLKSKIKRFFLKKSFI